MRKIGLLLTAVGSAALVSTAAVQGVAAAAGEAAHPAAVVLSFDTMAPVTGPYVGTPNPIRGIAGGGLPWIITSGRGTLRANGQVSISVRGLVLARTSSVPPALRGTNPVKDFVAIVSCQSIGKGGTATVVNRTTRKFPASKAGNSRIQGMVKLPRTCIAPIVFVAGPGFWLAATGN